MNAAELEGMLCGGEAHWAELFSSLQVLMLRWAPLAAGFTYTLTTQIREGRQRARPTLGKKRK